MQTQYILLDPTKGSSKYKVNSSANTHIFDYPCESYSDCTEYVIALRPAVYKFELYGASGGAANGYVSSFIDSNGNCVPDEFVQTLNGNARCRKVGNRGGAGGYISGVIKITRPITAFATIGGQGNFSYNVKYETFDVDKIIKGGYGGGGYSFNFYSSETKFGAGSGGGQTAVKFLENDLWHRVIVSGGGGGADNVDEGNNYMGDDDGSGGAGGGLVAQTYWSNGHYIFSNPANSTFGFTFGSGESAQEIKSKSDYGVKVATGGRDRSGAGSGWFGGFASQFGNAGSGGGSSWALSMDAEIPKGNIPAKGPFYDQPDSKKYFFSLSDGFIFTDVKSFPGIREGNGRLVITILQLIEKPSLRSICYLKFGFDILFIQLISQT